MKIRWKGDDYHWGVDDFIMEITALVVITIILLVTRGVN